MDVEHDAEQRFIDEAYAWLRWMHKRAEELVRGTDRRELDVIACPQAEGGEPRRQRPAAVLRADRPVVRGGAPHRAAPRRGPAR